MNGHTACGFLGVPRLKSSRVGLSAASPRSPGSRPGLAAGFPLLSLTQSAAGNSWKPPEADGIQRTREKRGRGLVGARSMQAWPGLRQQIGFLEYRAPAIRMNILVREHALVHCDPVSAKKKGSWAYMVVAAVSCSFRVWKERNVEPCSHNNGRVVQGRAPAVQDA